MDQKPTLGYVYPGPQVFLAVLLFFSHLATNEIYTIMHTLDNVLKEVGLCWQLMAGQETNIILFLVPASSKVSACL